MYGCLRLTRVKLAILAGILIATLLAVVVFNRPEGIAVNADLNENRVDFIAALGVEVDEQNYLIKSVIIPNSFNDVYIQYNNLQKSAGYDLEKYAGKTVTQYTYYFKNSDTNRVNLLVYRQKIIGGDISSARLDGSMQALLPQNNNG